MIEIGKTIIKGLQGKYRVVEKIDYGPVSAIYVGIEQEYNDQVAIKTLPRKVDPRGNFARQFRKEARILNNLNSSYVPEIFGLGNYR